MGNIAPRRQIQPFDAVTARRISLCGTTYTPRVAETPTHSSVNFEADLPATEPDGSLWSIKYPTTKDRAAAVSVGGVWGFISTLP